MKNELFMSRAEELYEDAKNIVIENDKGSTSLLQRKLKIGYGVACALIELLEIREIVGPEDGPKPRKVIFKTPMNQQKEGTMEERFLKLWNEHDRTHFYRDEFLEFCRSEISSALAQRDEEARKNVGMLRQWLNEDRITLPENMVLDEEILSWFAPTSLNPKKE